MRKIRIEIEVSARHVHLSQKDIELLFGENHTLEPQRAISMKGQFATKETVRIEGKKRAFEGVRIVGPARPKSQVELATSDCYFLGVKPIYKVSGDLRGVPTVRLVGPKGSVYVPVIVPLRHIHISEILAKKYGLKNRQCVDVEIAGLRPVVFRKVIVRIHKTFRFRLHLDTDEGNTAGISSGDKGVISL